MLLTGDLQKQIYDAFKGKLLKGLIRQAVVDSSAGLDAFGDPIDTGSVDTACEGFTENYSDYFYASGIPQTDLKVNIFAGSIKGITPGKDDLVMLKGITGEQWYQLRGPIRTDPATALWTAQGFPVATPS
jgi:hypothetical protein